MMMSFLGAGRKPCGHSGQEQSEQVQSQVCRVVHHHLLSGACSLARSQSCSPRFTLGARSQSCSPRFTLGALLEKKVDVDKRGLGMTDYNGMVTKPLGCRPPISKESSMDRPTFLDKVWI